MQFVNELESYNGSVLNNKKVAKVIRLLPQSFEQLAIVFSMMNFTFEQVVTAVQAEMVRRKNYRTSVADAEFAPHKARFA